MVKDTEITQEECCVIENKVFAFVLVFKKEKMVNHSTESNAEETR